MKNLDCHFVPFVFIIFTTMRFSAKNWKEKDARIGAKAFAEKWEGKGYEKGECQVFWLSLLRDVFGVEKPEEYISFEDQVKLDKTSFIDAFISATHVMIEQKGLGKNLQKPVRQSDGRYLTPFQQAKRYSAELPYSERPRWIVTSNFAEFFVYDMENPHADPEIILLKDLPKEYHRLSFLVDDESLNSKREIDVSVKAGEIVGEIYDALLPEFGDKPTAADLHALNVLCVRLVFCLYAEDAGIFAKEQFYKYLKSFRPENMRVALRELFRVLDTPLDTRDRFMEEKLAGFPYVNGSLFHEKEGETIPPISEKTAEILLNHASLDFDWSEISPTIFGAVFESTLNPETRRKGGMHYTSIENIHKVIDPLFMDDLKNEFHEIVPSTGKVLTKNQRQKLLALQDKLSSLKFLDPACGSGNFLTETYTSLRKLENQILMQLMDDKIVMGEIANPVKVDINQFYGIEINDFAVNVAKSALWIAESQMLKETENIVQRDIDFLPLKTNATIVEGNALRMDWEYLHEYAPEPTFFADKVNVVSPKDIAPSKPMVVAEPLRHYDAITVVTEDLHVGKTVKTSYTKNHYNFIMGNPPFVGARLMDESQKSDVAFVFGKKKNIGNLDYVSCWYKKTADLIKGTNTKAALVSTNSITQGEQPAILWKPFFDEGLHIDFAYRTFRWDSESEQKAHVHCVIIGFSDACRKAAPMRIFDSDGTIVEAKNINAYLMDALNVFVESSQKPLSNVPEIGIGNKPIDGGYYLFTEEEKIAFVKKEPASEPFFKKWIGSDEFINRYHRWCLWLGDCTPAQIRQMHECYRRVQAVREFRLASKSGPTRKLAERPTRFHVENFPVGNYIVIPKVSSERRRYIPLGFLTPDIFCSDLVFIIRNVTLYHFGILTSNVHMAWVRAVCGRLESRYRYSKDIVYNNFPWPKVSVEQTAKIERTAQNILDVRAKYPVSSLADLYDEAAMPAELRKAHAENDKAVMEVYGFSSKMSEEEIVAELFKMYHDLTKKES